MSSSNRLPGKCEAALYRDEKPVGPIRLPRRDSQTFVTEFNQLYRTAGLELQGVVTDSDVESPD